MNLYFDLVRDLALLDQRPHHREVILDGIHNCYFAAGKPLRDDLQIQHLLRRGRYSDARHMALCEAESRAESSLLAA